ncbi:hypothetical protein PCANB_000670 [Pneumocystis canis]|nr:hypothetical protein PCK1_000746 [Pneumocystis canis]KAG5437633.1 hypothetical protein PCANB_000670 [Pneumocystis canis]
MNFPVKFLLPTEKIDSIGASDIDFSEPLYIHTLYVSELISIMLIRERSVLALERYDLNVKKTKSVLILCGYKQETFLHEIMFPYISNKSYINDEMKVKMINQIDRPFWMSENNATGAWISSAENIDIIYVPSLKGLRAVLSNNHYSFDSSYNMFAIWPFLRIHELSGEFTAQGLSKTIALAIEVSRNKNIIFSDSLSIKSPIQLLNSSVKISKVSDCPAIKQIAVTNVLERWIGAFWEIIGLDEQGKHYGIWKYHGEYWKISWKNMNTKNGEISDIEYKRLD